MPVHVALLRGINVFGRSRIAMADLRDVFEAAGFADVRTMLQTGNVLFRSERRTDSSLERLSEAETETRLKVSVDYLIRSAEDWESVVADNPFPAEAERDPSHLVVLCLKRAPGAAEVESLRAAIRAPETVSVVGQQAFACYPAGIGRSKLTIALIERKLGARGTGRNWNAVLKIAALASE